MMDINKALKPSIVRTDFNLSTSSFLFFTWGCEISYILCILNNLELIPLPSEPSGLCGSLYLLTSVFH